MNVKVFFSPFKSTQAPEGTPGSGRGGGGSGVCPAIDAVPEAPAATSVQPTDMVSPQESLRTGVSSQLRC